MSLQRVCSVIRLVRMDYDYLHIDCIELFEDRGIKVMRVLGKNFRKNDLG